MSGILPGDPFNIVVFFVNHAGLFAEIVTKVKANCTVVGMVSDGVSAIVSLV
jgi:hypothetical protein